MHYSEQVLLKQQLADAEKILNDLEALDKLPEPTVKEFVSAMRRIVEWKKKATSTDGEWQPLGDAQIKMLEMAAKIGEKLVA